MLTARGQRCESVALPASDADAEQLAAALRTLAEDGSAVRVVHLAALDANASAAAGPSMRSLLRMQHRTLSGTRRLFRAAAAAELRSPIWLVTRGAQHATDADTVAPEQSCLWGFGRAAALELPQLWGGLADLAADRDTAPHEWARLIDLIGSAPDSAAREDQVAIRDQAVLVPVWCAGPAGPQQTRCRCATTPPIW